MIDFIREGPPTAGARRIPRTVAPFRNTMDSDDLAYEQGATPSAASTRGESSLKSQASAGSRSGLLNSSKGQSTTVKAPPKAPSSSSNKPTVEDDPLPKRTQSRVPDPYAIDWDDEELEAMLEEEEKPKKPQREEESLIDFLRNVPPPESESQAQPIAPRTKTPTGGFAGASSMKARLLRNASSEKGPLSKGPSAKSSQASLRQQPDPNSRRPSNYTTKSTSERNADAKYGLPAVSERQTETSALADFLRNTEPPEPPKPPPTKDSGLSRFFVRRKKVEA